jgi:hypothetical protein
MRAYALTIFTGAFLLFQVQPLIGKFILPWFGGGPGVWTTCMLFFQVLLLGGYAYAHLTSRCLKSRAQAIVHLILLGAALALLSIITPPDSWEPQGGGNPTLQILALLTASLGLPYFVLSSTSPLMQEWFSRTNPGVSPYRLYALSNAGALLALVSYPFYFETHFTRKAQAGLWAWGLVVFVIGCGFCAMKLWRKAGDECRATSGGGQKFAMPGPRSSTLDRLLWLLLPACASVLLLATTNKLCQGVAVIPFLWVLPLALYLLSFVICFDNPRWYARFPFTLALIAALGGVCWVLFEGVDLWIYKQVGIYSGALFICCMVCHGELYRLKPEPRHLTSFYLMIAAGGALGGLFVAVAAPLLFTGYYELHWGLLLCGGLFTFICARDRNPTGIHQWRWLACTLSLAVFVGLDRSLAWLGGRYHTIPKGCFIGLRAGMWVFLILLVAAWVWRRRFKTFQLWRFVTCVWLSLGLLALGAALWMQVRTDSRDSVYRSRNFYGVLAVLEYHKDDPAAHYFLLQHGRITHGLQFVDPLRAAWPTTYYGQESGVGLAINALPAGGKRIGLVGLGAGTITAYGQPGDYLRIYEINPEVERLAMLRFTYLTHCRGKVEVVLGDARLSMEHELPQHFDLLALDAFSSDAIPVHLLTKEAFEIYGRHMKTNGIIAVHISNRYLDLEPVIVNLACHFNYKLAVISHNETDKEWWEYSSTWILLTRNEEMIRSFAISQAASAVTTNSVRVPLWTDDFASLFQILR